MAAGALMAVASAQSTIPMIGCFSLAAVSPATSRPSIRASLWAPPTRWKIVTGLRIIRVKSSPPSRW